MRSCRRRPFARRLGHGSTAASASLLKKNKVDVIWGEAKHLQAGRESSSSTASEAGRHAAAASGAEEACWSPAQYDGGAHHRRDRRASARAAGHRAGRQADLDRFRGAWCRPSMPKSLDRDGLGRHRHRVRVLLPHRWASEVTVVEVLPHDPAGRGCGESTAHRPQAAARSSGMKILSRAPRWRRWRRAPASTTATRR